MVAEALAAALSAARVRRMGAAEVPGGRRLLYLGITGVLHPCPPLYRLVFDKCPWEDGHAPFEGVPVLERVLAAWPDVAIVLTSRQVWTEGLRPVLRGLGPVLRDRVVGDTFSALVKYAGQGGGIPALGSDHYRSLSKAEIVREHVRLVEPSGWVAIDDDGSAWSTLERRSHLTLTDATRGLLDRDAEERLWLVMLSRFGMPSSSKSKMPTHALR